MSTGIGYLAQKNISFSPKLKQILNNTSNKNLYKLYNKNIIIVNFVK